MRSPAIWFLAGFLSLTIVAAKSPFAGIWEGKINGQPGVDLTIDDAGGKVVGKTLAFEVLHRKTHGSPEPGPNVKFRMELTSANEAVLRKVQDQPDVAPVKLTRRRSVAADK